LSNNLFRGAVPASILMVGSSSQSTTSSYRSGNFNDNFLCMPWYSYVPSFEVSARRSQSRDLQTLRRPYIVDTSLQYGVRTLLSNKNILPPLPLDIIRPLASGAVRQFRMTFLL
jgi:hypothetical protein